MPSTTRIDGVVLDVNGLGVADARVCATALGNGLESVDRLAASSCGVSARDGTFSLALGGRGRAAVVAFGPRLVATAWGAQPRFPTVQLAGLPIEGLVLRVRNDGVTVRGTVVDRFGGPIAGAIVVAGSGTRAGAPIGERVLTDDHGRFALTVDSTVERVIGAFATGYAPGGARIMPAEGAEVEITLDPEGRLDGVAVDARTGAPVAGLRVVAPEAPVPVVAISDARGRFSLRGLPAGEYTPEASGEGRFGRASAPVALDAAASADVRIEIHPAGRILIDVEGDLHPCELPRFQAAQGELVSSVVAPPGDVALHVMRPGAWEVSMSCEARRSDVAAVDVVMGEDAAVALHWADGGGITIAGRVFRDQHGLGGERVRLWREDDVVQTATSGDDGRFVLSSVPAGRYVLTAGTVDRRAASSIDVEVATSDVDGLDVVSPAVAGARVRVVQRDGAPCPNAQVRVRGAFVSHACQTDDSGTCRMVGLAPGSSEFFVPTDADVDAPTDDAQALVAVASDLIGGMTADVTLRLPEIRGTVGGTVRQDGAPVPGARVTVRRELADDEEPATRPWAAAVTDPDGGFVLAGLPTGRWTLRAVGPTGASATVRGVSTGEKCDVVLLAGE